MIVQLILFSISLAMVYFVLSAGFSLIFGLMDVLNYAHASFVMWGAYFTYFAYQRTGSFILGLLIGIAVGVAVGTAIEVFLIRNIRGDQTNQLLLTFGLIYIMNELVKIFFGTSTIFPNRPALFQKSIPMGDLVFPVYRLILIIMGVVVYILLMLLINKTRLGMTIRAGTENPKMVRACGINIRNIFTMSFGIGIFLAALGGGLACFFLGLYPDLANDQLFNILVIVIIGGVGSIQGTFVASILIGLTQYFVGYYFPVLSMAASMILMVIILIIKPTGLFKAGASNE
ncbi:MAG: branched-chain amino acid ABC transporter permease [Lachnospiraceae bacterium]|nr:branched-chain amino acid ABC transporter permease [Lachnospiraceae bacterium]